jgi:hypothetical protein
MTRLAVLGAALLAFAAVTPPASATCKHHSGTLASSYGNRVWHTGSTLFGCEGQNADQFPQVKLGRWAPGTKVKLAYGFVAWTVPGGSGTGRYDRVNAMSIAIGSSWTSWLRNKRAVPAGTSSSAHDARVQSLVTRVAALAWITTMGDVVMGVQEPTKPPEPIGDLTTTLRAQKNLVLVGSWPKGSAADLAKSVKFIFQQGDSACSYVGDKYTLTVQPPGLADRAGARWFDRSPYLDCP